MLMIRIPPAVVSLMRIGIGLLVVVALVVQLQSVASQGKSLVNFLSFFTIQSNLLAAFVLLSAGLTGLARRRPSSYFGFLRGAATLYMVMTGIIFMLLLAGLEQRLQVTIPWVNIVLHYIAPVWMLADWLLLPPREALRLRQAAWWLVFPLAYLAYSLIRGVLVGWYPYPFLDVAEVGWVQVVGTACGIAVGAFALTWLLAYRTRISARASR